MPVDARHGSVSSVPVQARDESSCSFLNRAESKGVRVGGQEQEEGVLEDENNV